MEAYNYFVIGRENYERWYLNDALQFFKKALQADSTFAVAYLWLGWTLDALAKAEARNSAFKQAKAYSDNASEKEKLYIEAAYAEYIENNLDKKLGILKQLTTKFSREKTGHHLLALHYEYRMRLNTKALQVYKIALELDPNHGPSLVDL